MTARNPSFAGPFKSWRIGRRKARVLPDPVGAQAMISRPCQCCISQCAFDRRKGGKTHMEHNRNGLPLNWGRSLVHGIDVLSDVRLEFVARNIVIGKG